MVEFKKKYIETLLLNEISFQDCHGQHKGGKYSVFSFIFSENVDQKAINRVGIEPKTYILQF